MNNKLSKKISSLPQSSGVYFHLDKQGNIIYVGKAANLKTRVGQYFNKINPKQLSLKDIKLREQIADIDWRLTENSLQALHLESELIKRYQPKYNILSRHSNFDSWYYLAFSFDKSNPSLRLVRNIDDAPDCDYLGPYLNGQPLKIILKYIRKSFPFSQHKTLPKSACLDFHLGLCSGPETKGFNSKVAILDLKNLKHYLSGNHRVLQRKLIKNMSEASSNLNYEDAAKYRNQIQALKDFKDSLIFKDSSSLLSTTDQALIQLKTLLNLYSDLERIETYDISHISGSNVVASMIVAQYGIIESSQSRRFKSEMSVNNDFAQIENIIKKRFKMASLKNIQPQLIIVDGGKAQVSAVSQALANLNLDIAVIGIAKKLEQIIFQNDTFELNLNYLQNLKGSSSVSSSFTTLNIPHNTHIIKFFQRLRDASHRKAITYHQYLRNKSQTNSDLLKLPHIGLKTYSKLINKFGSIKALSLANKDDLSQMLNSKQIESIQAYFKQ